MLSDGALTYAYDSANRLKSVSSNGVMLVTNFYDAKSRRVKKVTPEATHAFFYDGWNLIKERISYTNGTSSTIRFMVKAYNAAGAGPAAVTDGWRYREYAILFYTIDHERVEWDEPSFDR